MERSGVPFVDFKARVATLRGELDEAVSRVLESGWFVLGPEVEAFEDELRRAFGAGEAVGVANGTDALQLGLAAHGVGPGDEVITTSLSAAFTALAIVSTGARPVFVDVDRQTLNLDPEAVRRAVTEKTRAIVPVHLYGQPAEMDPILACATEHDLAVVEDACQAHGATYGGRTVGTLGPCGALSFYPTKNLGALGDGGALLVADPEVAARVRRLRNGGQSGRYRHEEAGINSRLDEMQAAILRVGLGHLPAWTERRRALARLYRDGLRDSALGLPPEVAGTEAVHHLFVVRHPERDGIMNALREKGVATLIHYPIPLHLQPAFGAFGPARGDLPAVEAAADEIFSLPLYPELTDVQAETVVGAVLDVTSRL